MLLLRVLGFAFVCVAWISSVACYRDGVGRPSLDHSVIVVYSEAEESPLFMLESERQARISGQSPGAKQILGTLGFHGFETMHLSEGYVLVLNSDPETVASVVESHLAEESTEKQYRVLAVEPNQRVRIHASSQSRGRFYGEYKPASLTKPGGKVRINNNPASLIEPARQKKDLSSLSKPGGKVRVHSVGSETASKSRFSPLFTQPSSSSTPAPWHIDILDGKKGDNTNAIDGYYSSTVTGGENPVFVYVVDTGVDTTISELGGRVAFLADVTGSHETGDCNGHGTIVASMVTSTTYGAGKGVYVKSIRALDCNGEGFISDIISAITTAVNHATSASKVINLSLGSSGPSISLDLKIQDAFLNRGVVVVVSSGNDGADACDFSPSRAAYALTVGSHTPDAAISSFSNSGSCVDLYAPGEPIEGPTITGLLVTVTGTSFSSPLVAALAAMTFAHQPSMTASDVVSTLESVAYSASSPSSVLFAKNPFPSPVELQGKGDIGTNIPDYSGSQTSLVPRAIAAVTVLFGLLAALINFSH